MFLLRLLLFTEVSVIGVLFEVVCSGWICTWYARRKSDAVQSGDENEYEYEHGEFETQRTADAVVPEAQ